MAETASVLPWMIEAYADAGERIAELESLVADAGSEMKRVESNANEWVRVKDERIKALKDGIKAMTVTHPINDAAGIEVAAITGDRLVLHCRALLAEEQSTD